MAASQRQFWAAPAFLRATRSVILHDMDDHRNKRNNRGHWKLALSELSCCAFVLLLLFLIKQSLIILGCSSGICALYSRIYPWLMVSIPIACVVWIMVSAMYPSARRGGKLYGLFSRSNYLCVAINGLIGVLCGAALINTLLMFVANPLRNDGPADMTILYDRGSMSEWMVRELATPLALELRPRHIQVAALPLEEKTLAASLAAASYVAVLSHGDDGKVYTTRPLRPYTFGQFASFPKGNLKWIYFSACYLGIDGYDALWRKAMEPADIFLYDRESAILEHAFWLLFRAKSAISR